MSDHIYVAGQIGLIPHTMQLPTSTPSETPGSALLEEATISLRSLGRIIDATGASLLRDAAGGICYLADAKYITVVRRLWEMTLGAEVILAYKPCPMSRIHYECYRLLRKFQSSL